MKRWRVRTATKPLAGELRVPGDKSIGHRALIFAALAEGPCEIRGLSHGLDNHATAGALAEMGVTIVRDGTDARVEGVGLRGLETQRGEHLADDVVPEHLAVELGLARVGGEGHADGGLRLGDFRRSDGFVVLGVPTLADGRSFLLRAAAWTHSHSVPDAGRL